MPKRRKKNIQIGENWTWWKEKDLIDIPGERSSMDTSEKKEDRWKWSSQSRGKPEQSGPDLQLATSPHLYHIFYVVLQ